MSPLQKMCLAFSCDIDSCVGSGAVVALRSKGIKERKIRCFEGVSYYVLL